MQLGSLLRPLSFALALMAGGSAAARPATLGNNTVPILVVIGGLGSCEGPLESRAMLHAADALTHELSRRGDRTAGYLYACFGSTSAERVQLTSSSTGASWSSSVDLLRDAVVSFADKVGGPKARVYVVGHSYGGHFAMRVALGLPKRLAPGYLATIDPISATDCPVAAYRSSLRGYGASSQEQTQTAGCRIAPDTRLATQVGQRVRVWDHFYQSDFEPLRSRGIAAAATATNFRLTVGTQSARAHTALGSDPRAWAVVRKRVMAFEGID